jgi:hypothetical protein
VFTELRPAKALLVDRIFPFSYTVGGGANSRVPVDLIGDGYPDRVRTDHQSVVVLVNDGLWRADPR